jgi:predicted DNA-binding WGR domain protein
MEIYFENRTWPYAKCYRLKIDLVLFNVGLKREWGRIGRKKREKVEYFKTWKEAEKVYQKLYWRCLKHEYKATKRKKQDIQLELPL